MSVIGRYFFADDPSPITPVRERIVAERDAMRDRADALAAEFGAKAACTRRFMPGLVFEGEPPAGKYRRVDTTKDSSQPVWYPISRSKEGRALGRRISAIRTNYTEEQAITELGLYFEVCTGKGFRFSTLGWIGARSFLIVPWDMEPREGRPNPTIPDWLTECSEFEMSAFYANEKANES